MEQIKDIKIMETTIEIKLAKGYLVNEYQLQCIHLEPDLLPFRKDKRSKTLLYYDTRHICSLQYYLHHTVLEGISFIKLLIHMLERIHQLQKDRYILASIDTIFFKDDGSMNFLALPISKVEFEPMDQELRDLLIEIVKIVQLQEGNEILGLTIQHLKNSNFHITTYLQDLHNRLPTKPKRSLLQRMFMQSKALEDTPYPLPKLIEHNMAPQNPYVEEIEEKEEKTTMLFEGKMEEVYLEGDADRIPISKKEFKIGRNKTNDYYLSLPSISKEHAVIIQEEEGFYIKDLHSSNATFVNGKKLKPMKHIRLHDQDQVAFADVIFEFHEYT